MIRSMLWMIIVIDKNGSRPTQFHFDFSLTKMCVRFALFFFPADKTRSASTHCLSSVRYIANNIVHGDKIIEPIAADAIPNNANEIQIPSTASVAAAIPTTIPHPEYNVWGVDFACVSQHSACEFDHDKSSIDVLIIVAHTEFIQSGKGHRRSR